MSINGIEYLSFSNLLPQIPSNVLESSDEIREKLRQTFKETKVNENLIIEIIEQAKLQKHGTMVVISMDAKDEAERLKESCTLISPNRLEKGILELVTRIDGSIMCDTNGTCYAIGVILDGIISPKADPARGARYNSAIRYIEKQKLNNQKTFIVVISEDEYIDYISTSD
jgi:hypothetical protein